MKRFNIPVILGILSAGLVSCNKDAVPARGEMSDEIVFTLTDELRSQVLTKGAAEVKTDNLSSIKVTATTGTSTEAAVSGFSNVTFNKGTGSWSASPAKFWPGTNPGYHFYACNVDLAVGASGATVAPANADTDIVVGYIATPTYKASNAFTLNHIFAQVGTVNITAPSGYKVNDLKLTLKPIVSGTYNLKSDAWTRGAAGADFYLLGTAAAGVNITTEGGSASHADHDLWLVPGSYVITATYSYTKGDFTSSVHTATSNVTLVQGKNNNITGALVLKDDDVPSDISITVTVTPWGDNDLEASFTATS